MTDNLTLWHKHADIDPKFTKPITGKAYKGTSPSPQHVLWCLTDLFGPVGKGWGAHVVAEGFQPLGDEILHWCRIEFWHGERANTFEAYGQTKALMKTRNGLMSDEDAPKKSFTDALVKAASYIGVAANIFLGRWDDQKYVHDLKRQFGAPQNGDADKPKTPAGNSAIPVQNAIEQINNANDLTGLQNVWEAISEDVRFLPVVLDATNKRKAYLMQAPAPQPDNSDIDDEIPFG